MVEHDRGDLLGDLVAYRAVQGDALVDDDAAAPLGGLRSDRRSPEAVDEAVLDPGVRMLEIDRGYAVAVGAVALVATINLAMMALFKTEGM